MDDSLDTWFKREVLVHEALLLRYLRRVWSRRDDVHDLRQEIYVRVYEAARKARPSAPRAFMLATARNLVADRIRRSRVVRIEAVGDPDVLNVIADELTPERKLSAWQELKRVGRAFNELPPRCRQIVWLKKVDELSMREVADALGLSVRTVENQVLKGMRLLSNTVYGSDAPCGREDPEVMTEKAAEHGKQ
ncbi:MAG TPA: sigma-70 family RNA polymerase sigma factor [Steroidobacteraceae bacterium]|nr:sigma-70 family RNA polymerase sigma factor [Steroidobacteraceae bacterium]